MKRFAIVFLVFCLALPACVYAQEQPPTGLWVEADGSWVFQLLADYSLPEETAAAFATQFPGMLSGTTLPAGIVLSQQQLLVAFPEYVGLLNPPEDAVQAALESSLETPPIEAFALDGEWYYGEDDILYYDAGEGYRALTVDEVFAMLNGSEEEKTGENKKVYFTFDDAPSKYTMELLATLDSLGVTATFFVVGAYVQSMPVFLRAIYEQGHVIGNHSFSHDQSILSESVDACLLDFKKCQNRVNEALGFEYPMSVLRVPYGSSTISYESQAALQAQGYLWIDWNALNGDAEAGIDSDEESYDYAISTASRCSGDVVLLMHDGKKRTIRTLPALVEYFRENGYTFDVISTEIAEKIPGVRMGFPSE